MAPSNMHTPTLPMHTVLNIHLHLVLHDHIRAVIQLLSHFFPLNIMSPPSPLHMHLLKDYCCRHSSYRSGTLKTWSILMPTKTREKNLRTNIFELQVESFNLAYILTAIPKEVQFLTYIAAHHQRVIDMFWLHF